MPASAYSSLTLGPRRLRILVVDDDANTREMLAEALQLFGAEVRTAPEAGSAHDVLDAWHPDVLISDVGMPGQDGYDFLQCLRRQPADRGGRIPAIAFTGYAREQDRVRALAAGYHDIVAKPVDLERLLSAIARLPLPETGTARQRKEARGTATATRRRAAGCTASSR